VTDFESFRALPSGSEEDRRLSLRWETPYRIAVEVEARLPTADELELRARRGTRAIAPSSLRYPAIQGIGTLSATAPATASTRPPWAPCSDPFHLFRGGDPIPAGRGLAISRYPNGFHGSPLQLMAYYAEGRGGFYFASKDVDSRDKDLNFYKAPDDGSLSCEFAHIQPEARAGASLVADYPVVIAP
jgi:hypothetical protein